MKKQSNFLLLFLLCLLEPQPSRFCTASRYTEYPPRGTREPRQGRRVTVSSDDETPAGRHPKRRLSPDTNVIADKPSNKDTNFREGELLDIRKVNKQMDLSSLEGPFLFKPVINQRPPTAFKSNVFAESTLQGPHHSAFEPHTGSGYKTPPPKTDLKQPTSNDSITSSASSSSYSSTNSNSSSLASIYSFPMFSHEPTTSNFNIRPGHFATLSTFGSNASSLDLDSRANGKTRYQSKSLINDNSGDLDFPPSIAHTYVFKHDGHFLEKLDQHGLGCRSSDLDSEDGDISGTELDDDNLFDIKESADTGYCSTNLTSRTGYRSSSATSELGRHLAATSIENCRCPSVEHVKADEVMIIEKGKPPFEVEYAPWIPEDVEDSFLYNSFNNLQTDFELKPLIDTVESVEAPETEEGRNFFRNVFKPFQDYGEFSYDEVKLKDAIEVIRPLSEFVTEKVAELRAKNIGRQVVSVRHEDALRYAKNLPEGSIESQWVYTFVNGGTVDFMSYYEDIKETEEIAKWSVERGRKLICAMIPSIMFSSNFEEVLIDFLDDFFLPHVLEYENEHLETEEAQAEMIKELVRIGKKMIKHSLSHKIIESYLLYIKPLLLESDSVMFYETLVDTMNKFIMPKPFVSPKRKQPEQSDEKYADISDPVEKEKAYQFDLSKYQEKVKKDERKARYQEDIIRVKHIHKNRSFETLKVLVALFPESIMRPDSRWLNGNYLRMPKYQVEIEEGNDDVDEKQESSRKKKKQMVNEKLFGVGAHENQDFFDALFFSRILRACLVQENTIELAANSLEPFLKSFQIKGFDLPLSFRYLKVVDKFIRITRFNVVANCPPPIINYKRYLIAYLIRNGASWMGIVPGKVQSRAINFEFLSLFEALHLYQVVDPSTLPEREQRMKALLATKDIDYKFPIIYHTYNPIQYSAIVRIIEEVSKEVQSISFSKLNAYYEIFAMVKNVDLLPITERKVLRFLNVEKSPEDPIEALQSNNEDLEFRRPLPKSYEAVFVWNMPRRLKNLSELGNHLNYPYGTFASRIVMARRFGVSFDATNFIPQLSENFTWLECIDFINFFLEREAQLLIESANTVGIDADLYQVYRVVDTQRHLHKIRQMDSDEPTHHINLLIESGLNGLPNEEANAIRSKFTRSQLFNLYRRGLGKIEPPVLLRLTRDQSVKILKWFVDDDNIPETFKLKVAD